MHESFLLPKAHTAWHSTAKEGYLFGSKATGFKLATYFHVVST